MGFAQSLFSVNESSGVLEARIIASGFSQRPYTVVVTPTESNPSSALGMYVHI